MMAAAVLQTTVFVVVAVLALVPVNGHDGYRKGWVCQTCVEAMAVFRGQFQCTSAAPVVAPGTNPDLQPCPYTGVCSRYSDTEAKEMCLSMAAYFNEQSAYRTYVWKSTVTGVDPYLQCVRAGKCPNPSLKDGKYCKMKLEDDVCGGGPECKSSPAKCNYKACEVCYWVIKTWPKWYGMCAPTYKVPPKKGETASNRFMTVEDTDAAGTDNTDRRRSPSSSSLSLSSALTSHASDLEDTEAQLKQLEQLAAQAGLTDEASPDSALLLVDQSVRRRSHLRSTAETRRRGRRTRSSSSPRFVDEAAQDGEGEGEETGSGSDVFPFTRDGLGSVPLAAALDADPRDQASLTRGCLDMWEYIQTTPAARVYAQVAQTLGPYPWDPELACMCLGKCPYDSIEGLGVHASCKIPVSEAHAENMFPELSPLHFPNRD